MAIPRAVLAAALPAVLAAAAQGQDRTPGLVESLRDFEEAGIQAGDGKTSLRIGGRFATDAILWDRRNVRHSGIETGAAAPRLDLRTGGGLRVFVEGDLVGDATPDHLAEAWAGVRLSESLRLRAGLMRIALGTEGATPEEDLPLVGRSFASWIDGRTDVAARAEGALAGGAFWYEGTFATGHGFGPEGGGRTSPQTSVRAVLRPFRTGPFLGAGAARLSTFEDPLVLDTPLGIPVFRTPDLEGDGARWVHVETGLAAGPLAAGLEVARGGIEGIRGPSGRPDRFDEFTAWTATLALGLTGEERTWEEGAWRAPAPRGPGGAWEIAVRYSNADMDRDLFRAGWTTYDPSTQEVRTFSALLGWRPAQHARVAVGWVKTIADDALTVFGGAGPSAVSRVRGSNRDSSFVLRIEIAF